MGRNRSYPSVGFPSYPKRSTLEGWKAVQEARAGTGACPAAVLASPTTLSEDPVAVGPPHKRRRLQEDNVGHLWQQASQSLSNSNCYPCHNARTTPQTPATPGRQCWPPAATGLSIAQHSICYPCHNALLDYEGIGPAHKRWRL